jgi:hypothetical protein
MGGQVEELPESASFATGDICMKKPLGLRLGLVGPVRDFDMGALEKGMSGWPPLWNKHGCPCRGAGVGPKVDGWRALGGLPVG